jgi:branched-chain amino acid aminotransferase
MKAFRQKDGSISLFRPEKNIARLNHSSRRLCIPEVDESFILEALLKLVRIDQDWVPQKEGTSLYIRPFVFALEPFLGVRPAKVYRLMIILSPVGAYYSTGFSPVKILVEEKYARASLGGTGNTKAAGNYASSLLAAEEAHKAGFTQVLWLDSAEHKYVEEVGTMNIAFVINNELITPALGGSILGGVTRDSVLSLSRSWGIATQERPISIDEVFAAANNQTLNEVFGTGTAAVISAVGEMKYKNSVWKIPEWKAGPLAQRLFDEITSIQYGRQKDSFKWMVPLNP